MNKQQRELFKIKTYLSPLSSYFSLCLDRVFVIHQERQHFVLNHWFTNSTTEDVWIHTKFSRSLTLSPLWPISPYGDRQKREKQILNRSLKQFWFLGNRSGKSAYFDTRLTDGTFNTRVSWTTSSSFLSCFAVVSFSSLESTSSKEKTSAMLKVNSVCCKCLRV